jgi:hypothetical protein
VKAAQKLLGAPTIVGGSAQAGGGGGGRRQLSPEPAENHTNGTKNGWFPALFGLKITKNALFGSKVLCKIHSQHVF